MHIYANRRNLRLIYVNEAAIVSLLDWRRPGFLQLPVFGGLPDGVRVVGVGHDWNRQAFAVCIYHPEFSEVPDGEQIPDYDGWRDAKVETVEVVFDQEGPSEPLKVTIPGRI